MSSTEAPASVVDCTGELCPIPIIKTAQGMKQIEVGQLLELIATDPGVDPDIRAWTSRTGNELVDIRKDGGVFHVLLRRRG